MHDDSARALDAPAAESDGWKENLTQYAKKDPLFGRVDNFHSGPKHPMPK